ncbi:MAG: OmpH family outer membrane protein [Ferruginibacter sp.]|nr:OmpH family outer membrane protein [Ferruginibacter sp.]
MKQISLYLNILLTLAVGVLFYLHFSLKKSMEEKKNLQPKVNPVAKGSLSVAYVNIDSLYENVTFIKNKLNEIDAEQTSIENEFQAGYRDLESQKNAFAKKGNAITQEEYQKFEERFMTQKNQIDTKRQSRSAQLNDKAIKITNDIQNQLKVFLEEYNKQPNYSYIMATSAQLNFMLYKEPALNITDDIIKGMNAKLNK